MINLAILILILIIFIIFNRYAFNIGKNLSIMDSNKKIPLIGGIFLLIGFILNIIYLYYFQILTSSNVIILWFLVSMFIIALVDDKFNISPIFRLILCSFVIILFFINSGFLIKTLNFKYLNLYVFPENIFITYFFSIFCMIVLIHAYNFIDGINGLATSIGAIWLIYLCTKIPNFLNNYSVFFIFIILFLYLNLKNKMFLGDSGNYIISSLIGVNLIKENLSNPNLFYVEEILLLFLIPGLDLIRLFFYRIKNKKNPFVGDNEHFHHLLINKFSLKKTLFIYSTLVTVPLIILKINEDLLFFSIIISTLTYIFLIKNLYTKRN